MKKYESKYIENGWYYWNMKYDVTFRAKPFRQRVRISLSDSYFISLSDSIFTVLCIYFENYDRSNLDRSQIEFRFEIEVLVRFSYSDRFWLIDLIL